MINVSLYGVTEERLKKISKQLNLPYEKIVGMAIKELKNKLSIKNRADIEMEKAFNKLRESYPEIAKKLEIIENASLPIEEAISDKWGDEI